MKPLLPIFFWIWSGLAIARAGEVSPIAATDTSRPAPVNKPEILSSGFIDIVNNGQVNASARLIRLFIGEPGRFAIPLSIYSGVSSNNFQNPLASGGLRTNEQLITNFINPLSGLINLSAEGRFRLAGQKGKATQCGAIYQCGWRVLTGIKSGLAGNPLTGKPVNFLNGFAAAGISMQTGAWERNNARNIGICWMAARYILCRSSAKQIREIIPDIQTNGIYHGWSLGGGVEVNGLVNLKIIYYRYVKKPELEYSAPIYQFSFNYSIR